VLSLLKPVDMNEYNRPLCLPKTRLDVIKSITEWIADDHRDQKRVLWLHGLAGSGKSTLASTIVEMMQGLQHLGGFFLCNRYKAERNAGTIIRTLAYQLALFDAGIGAEVSRIVECNPNIAEMLPDFQFTNLLSATALNTVQWSGGPVVLVIDALDECGSEMDRKILLQVLSRGFSVLPPFIRIMVTSRRERDIEAIFASHLSVHAYNLDIDSVTTGEDILEFLQYRLAEIQLANKYIPFPPDWPGDDKIHALRESAAGLFIWASTACSYIESHNPLISLNQLVTQQAVDTSSSPFAALDQLYKTGLQSAGAWADPLFCSDCCNIFGAILCARSPLTITAIDALLGLPQPCLQSIFRLGCFLQWSETEPICILHPSFGDYLSGRCHTEPWFIDLKKHNMKLAIHCIELLDNSLHENICGLKLPHLVQKKSLQSAVAYACRFWVEHVCSISCISDDIGNQIYEFLGQHLLHWIEASAILKCHGETIQSLRNLLNWVKVCWPIQFEDPHN
jgi:hypothetical protein